MNYNEIIVIYMCHFYTDWYCRNVLSMTIPADNLSARIQFENGKNHLNFDKKNIDFSILSYEFSFFYLFIFNTTYLG